MPVQIQSGKVPTKGFTLLRTSLPATTTPTPTTPTIPTPPPKVTLPPKGSPFSVVDVGPGATSTTLKGDPFGGRVTLGGVVGIVGVVGVGVVVAGRLVLSKVNPFVGTLPD